MRVTKQPRLEFDYLDTIQKINKMQGSPRYLSKENLPINKNPNSSIFPKDSILNNIPIKVRLIRAAELNPNINMGKIHNLNRNAKTLKKELEIKKMKIIQKKMIKKVKTIIHLFQIPQKRKKIKAIMNQMQTLKIQKMKIMI